jgi:hypothetical protein
VAKVEEDAEFEVGCFEIIVDLGSVRIVEIGDGF